MINQPIIKIEKLSVIYCLGKSNEFQALKDINLEIYPGEFIIFFGPSGCGKSTLLYSISGLETNIQGAVLINGKNLAELKQKEIQQLHQKEIGMIFQAYYLISSISAFANVTLPRIFVNSSKPERVKKALDLMERFGVIDQADKLPTELSGGQQQRVAICRAVVNEPDIILADEPIGNLDSVASHEVMKLLKELNERLRKTVILVTHDPAFLSYADRLFYMRDGRIIDIKVNKAVNEKVKETMVEPAAPQNISKDLELLFRTYSGLTSAYAGNLLLPFKAKQIVTDVLSGLTVEELSLIEKKVEGMLLHGLKSHEDSFTDYLDESVEKGGLGLDKRTARGLAEKIKEIVAEIKILEAEDEKIKAKQEADEANEAINVRKYLMDNFDLKIQDLKLLKIFDLAVKNRLENKIDRSALQKILDAPGDSGGVGLDKRTARKVVKRLELLILGKYK